MNFVKTTISRQHTTIRPTVIIEGLQQASLHLGYPICSQRQFDSRQRDGAGRPAMSKGDERRRWRGRGCGKRKKKNEEGQPVEWCRGETAGSLVQGDERRVSVRRRRVRGKIATGGRVGHVAPRRAVPAPSSRTPRVRLSSTSTPSTTAQPTDWLTGWLAGWLAGQLTS